MSRILRSFLCPVYAQILLACAAVFALTRCGAVCGYGTAAGIALIAVGGVSSALWGCVYQVKHNGRSPKEIAADFFRLKTPPKGYLLAAAFIVLDFLGAIFGGSLGADSVLTIPKLFLIALVMGGIEELAWRYTFQPFLEKKMPYFAAALVTFACWGIWHFLFFYIDGSLPVIEPLPFLTGLLMLSFMLSAIYRLTGNLWLCVMTHALVNTLAQTVSGGSKLAEIAGKIAIVALAVVLCEMKNRKDDE